MPQRHPIVSLITALHTKMIASRRVNVLADLISTTLPQSMDVLDVGCGNGLLACELKQRNCVSSIHGIDVKSPVRETITVSLYDGQTIPFENDSWDVVMAIDMLHHSEDPMATLRELSRVSKRFILLKDHIFASQLDYISLQFMDWVGNRGYGVDLPYNYYTADEWQKAFDTLGLSTKTYVKKLGIYPIPFTWLFDRNLHFLTLLQKKA